MARLGARSSENYICVHIDNAFEDNGNTLSKARLDGATQTKLGSRLSDDLALN